MRRRLPAGVQDVYGRRFQLSRTDRGATSRVSATRCWASSIRWPLPPPMPSTGWDRGCGGFPRHAGPDRAACAHDFPCAHAILQDGRRVLAWLNGFRIIS